MDGEESDSEELDSELEKDETEKELERLVFGDVEGFKESLKDFQLEDEDDAGDVGLRDTTGLEGLDDAAVGHHHNVFTHKMCNALKVGSFSLPTLAPLQEPSKSLPPRPMTMQKS